MTIHYVNWLSEFQRYERRYNIHDYDNDNVLRDTIQSYADSTYYFQRLIIREIWYNM